MYIPSTVHLLLRHNSHPLKQIHPGRFADTCERYAALSNNPASTPTDIICFVVSKMVVYILDVKLVHQYTSLYTPACAQSVLGGRWTVHNAKVSALHHQII